MDKLQKEESNKSISADQAKNKESSVSSSLVPSLPLAIGPLMPLAIGPPPLALTNQTTAPPYQPIDLKVQLNQENSSALRHPVRFQLHPVRELENLILKLNSMRPCTESSDIAKIESSLDAVEYYIEDLDLANDFLKMGGLSILKSLCDSTVESVSTKSFNILATIAQNNPQSWNYLNESNIIFWLINTLQKSLDMKIKNADAVLYAVSCILRGNNESIDCFHKSDGHIVLRNIITSDNYEQYEKRVYQKCRNIFNTLLEADNKTAENHLAYFEDTSNLIIVYLQQNENLGLSSMKKLAFLQILHSIIGHFPHSQNLLSKKADLNKIIEKIKHQIDEFQDDDFVLREDYTEVVNGLNDFIKDS